MSLGAQHPSSQGVPSVEGSCEASCVHCQPPGGHSTHKCPSIPTRRAAFPLGATGPEAGLMKLPPAARSHHAASACTAGWHRDAAAMETKQHAEPQTSLGTA